MTTVVTNDNCPVYYGMEDDIVKLDIKRVHNGTLFIAIDTSNKFLFDAENKIWHPCSSVE